jgi:PPM family protein phosphatase
MALRVVEHAGLSDVGRQREANEDSYVVELPVFAVADGMGGARAGEVASSTAIATLRGAASGEGTFEERLTRIFEEANRRIFELAQRDESRRGMGTTLTAAMLGEAGVSVGHVGDSRAYRLRDGELEQITRDHSLVDELRRSGRLSSEAARNHPQRSIITRALGPEAHVEVDAHTHPARGGDVYLLCSDGLTAMISDAEVAALLRGSRSLADAAEALVRAANQGGGKDNITVVLFRVEDDGGGSDEEDTLSGRETVHRGLTADDVRAAVDEQERSAAVSPVTTAGSAHRAGAPARAGVQPPRRRGGKALRLAVAALLVALLGVGLYLGVREVYFLGTDERGLVTLYRGLPYELPLGLELFSRQYTTSVPARALARRRRRRLLDHEWRSHGDAVDLVRQLERGTLDAGGPGR